MYDIEQNLSGGLVCTEVDTKQTNQTGNADPLLLFQFFVAETETLP